MNYNPLQLWHIVHEQKYRRAKKRGQHTNAVLFFSTSLWHEWSELLKHPDDTLKLHSPCQVSPGVLVRNPSWCDCRWKRQRKPMVYFCTQSLYHSRIAVAWQNWNSLCQEASTKISDAEIAQLAITLRPQWSLFYVMFWDQWATLTKMEGETL